VAPSTAVNREARKLAGPAVRIFGEFLTVAREAGQASRMASPENSGGKKKLPLAKLLIAAAVLAVIGAIGLYFFGLQRALHEYEIVKEAVIRRAIAAGPGVFFGAMALLPAAGMPTSPFALTAGPIFGEQLGLAMVTLYGIAALTFNLTVTYWLARRWLRPLLTRWLERAGYEVPKVEGSDMTDLIVLFRVTPGIPFFAQNYLLGLANVPFGRYMIISCAAQWSLNVAFILFGSALSQGKGQLALSAVMLFAALSVATHFVRKHYGKKKSVA
jgi:uncharacterized membrane protein YdjX (TVP38/TMEM64 family)